jgi:hypothetical protein
MEVMRVIRLRLLAIVLLAVFVVAGMNAAWAAQVDYFNSYLTFGGNYYDAEKMPKNYSQDSLMCWAAAASNVLSYTGWATTSLFQTDDIFKYYQDHWTNDGGLMEYGWNWWFSGVNPMQGQPDWSQVDVPGGGFFPTRNFSTYYHHQETTNLALSAIDSYLHSGYGVSAGIYTDSGGGHAITIWGYRYNSSNGAYLGVWITDSDDNKDSNNPPDTLQYYNVNSSGGRWYLQNYYGTSNAWYFGTIQGLAQNPDMVNTTYWLGASGSWQTANNWWKGVPDSTKTAWINNGVTVTIAAAAQCKDFYVGYDSGGLHSGAVQLNTGGSLSVATNLYLGYASGSSGTFDIWGGALTAATEYVGRAGTGVFSQYGSNNTVSGTLYVGYSSGGSGTYNLVVGALKANAGGSIRIGADSGTGRFAWLGGTIDTPSMALGANGTLAMGFNFSMDNLASGSIFLHGGTLSGLSSSTLEIMNYATATQSANTPALHFLRVGTSSGGGTYTMTGGQLNVNSGGSIRIGADGGTGAFNWNGGTVSAPTMTLGQNGTVVVGAGNTLLLSTSGGIGRLEWFGGTLTTPNMTLDSTGTLAMGINFNAGALADGSLVGGTVSGLPSATLEITNGATATQNSGVVGVRILNLGAASSVGNYTLSAGQLNISSGGSIHVGADGGTGRFAWLAGTVDTPSMVLGTNGTLALGFNFDMSNLVGGSLLPGLTGLSSGALEITNGATATETANIAGPKVLRIGSSSGGGTYSMTAGQLTINAGGSIRVGADGGSGRFEWYGGTLSTPAMVFGANGTLAMGGSSFNVANLANGSLWGGTVSGLSLATLEVTNGSTATENSGTLSIGGLNVGGASGSNKYTLSAGRITVSAGGSIRIGADGGTGRFEWYSAGIITTPSMVLGPNGTLANYFSFDMSSLTGGALLGGGTLSGLSSATLEIENWSTATQNSGVIGIGNLNLGGPSNYGKYTLNGGQLNIAAGGAIRVGVGGTGRFAWYGGTIDTPSLAVGANSTLAMGINFNVPDLVSGNLFVNGGTVTGLASATLEITNNATATENSGALGVRTLNIGGASTSGKYTLSAGAVNISAGGSIRVGADGGTGRLAWLGGSIDTPSMVLGTNGTLAMGYDFNASTLASGGLFLHGGTLTGLSGATLEVTNGATATQNTAGTFGIKNLTVGSLSGGGEYTLSSGVLSLSAGGAIRVGADGGTGRFEWYGGTIYAPSVVFGSAGSLSMGVNFSVNSLVNGTLFGGSSVTGLNNALLEVANGATATQAVGATLSVRNLLVGPTSAGAKYTMTGGQLNVGSGGSIIVGYNYSPARFEWLSGGIDTPAMALAPGGTLAIGFNFDMAALTGGTLFTHGGAFSGLNVGNLEIVNGAAATHGSTYSLAANVLLVGTNAGGAGHYTMNGGSLNANYEGVSGGGTMTMNAGTHEVIGPLAVGWENGTSGTFTQNGGVINMRGWIPPYNGLYVGFGGGGGTYNLQDGEIWAYTNEYIGHSGVAVFNQTGGKNMVNLGLYLGHDGGSNGTYNLSQGQLSAVGGGGGGNEYIGYNSAGLLHQTGGTNTVNQNLYIGYQWLGGPAWTGTYTLENGNLVVVSAEYVGYLGAGVFNQSGGTNTVTYGLGLAIGGGSGPYEGGFGTYNLSGGVLTVSNEAVGYYGNGTFVQTGGTHKSTGFGIAVGFGPATVGDYQQSAGSTTISNSLWLGYNTWSQGTYNLSGTGQLAVGTEYVGLVGSGVFNQTGGVNTVANFLNIGTSQGPGVYNLGGGTLTTKALILGAQGAWNITDSASVTNITVNLSFGAGARYSAVPGTRITLTGAGLSILSIVEGDLAGLANTELIFNGGTTVLSHLEVASAMDAGFVNNFAIGEIAVGDALFAGQLQLTDTYDNGNRGGAGEESLFINGLLINTGSFIDLNGFNVYVAGNEESLLDSWITDHRLRDGKLLSGWHLDAAYDSVNGWTEVQAVRNLGSLGSLGLSAMNFSVMDAPVAAVPEPGTFMALALGFIGLAWTLRRNLR